MALNTTTIQQREFIPAKPVQVYDAFINARKHAEFTGAKATCDPRVGGEFAAYDGYITGKILELVRARKVVLEWKTTEWPVGYPPSRLEFTFEEKGDGTEVIMVHSDVPDQQAENYRQGWIDYYWKPLREYFSK